MRPRSPSEARPALSITGGELGSVPDSINSRILARRSLSVMDHDSCVDTPHFSGLMHFVAGECAKVALYIEALEGLLIPDRAGSTARPSEGRKTTGDLCRRAGSRLDLPLSLGQTCRLSASL